MYKFKEIVDQIVIILYRQVGTQERFCKSLHTFEKLYLAK